MPMPGNKVAVDSLLLGGDLARHLGIHARAQRVEPGSHRLPRLAHARVVALQDGMHRVALQGRETQVAVQLAHQALDAVGPLGRRGGSVAHPHRPAADADDDSRPERRGERSEEHTSELQSQSNLVCRLLLEKKKNSIYRYSTLRSSLPCESEDCSTA